MAQPTIDTSVDPSIVAKAMDASIEQQLREKRLRDMDEESDSIVVGGGSKMSLTPKSFFQDPATILDQMGLNYRSVPTTMTYETCRQITEKNVVISAAIMTRLAQAYTFTVPQRNAYSVGFKISHMDPTRKLSKSEKDLVMKMTHTILNCGEGNPYGRDPFDTFTKKVLRDRLTYDQMNWECVSNFNGTPRSIHHVPAETIRLRRTPVKQDRAFTENEWRNMPRYVQLVDGVIMNDYTEDEMVFGVANPRTDLRGNGYGWSELEMLISTITNHLWAEQWNSKIFSQGSTVKGVLNVSGKIPKDQLESFRRHWYAMVSGVTNSWRTPVLNTDKLEWVPMQMSNNEMGYSQWIEYLIKMVCAVFLMDPAEINFDIRGGVGQQPMFMSTNEAQQKISRDRGLQPLLRFYSNWLTRSIIKKMHPDFMLEFVGLDAQTEAQAMELRTKEAQTYKTLNEIRSDQDMKPLDDGDVVLNPTYIAYVNQKAMQQQQGAAGGAPGGMPMPGMPPQGGGQPGAGGTPGAQPGMPPSPTALQVKPPPEAKKAKSDGDEDSSTEISQSHRNVNDWEFSLHASLDNELKKALEDLATCI